MCPSLLAPVQRGTDEADGVLDECFIIDIPYIQALGDTVEARALAKLRDQILCTSSSPRNEYDWVAERCTHSNRELPLPTGCREAPRSQQNRDCRQQPNIQHRLTQEGQHWFNQKSQRPIRACGYPRVFAYERHPVNRRRWR